MKKISLLLLSIIFVNLLFSQKVNSREEAISLMKVECNLFNSLDEKYRADKEIVLLALINCDGGGNFEYADKSLQKDKDFILDLIDKNALSLKDLDYSLRKDKEIIFKAVTDYSYEITYVDNDLLKDIELEKNQYISDVIEKIIQK